MINRKKAFVIITYLLLFTQLFTNIKMLLKYNRYFIEVRDKVSLTRFNQGKKAKNCDSDFANVLLKDKVTILTRSKHTQGITL